MEEGKVKRKEDDFSWCCCVVIGIIFVIFAVLFAVDMGFGLFFPTGPSYLQWIKITHVFFGVSLAFFFIVAVISLGFRKCAWIFEAILSLHFFLCASLCAFYLFFAVYSLYHSQFILSLLILSENDDRLIKLSSNIAEEEFVKTVNGRVSNKVPEFDTLPDYGKIVVKNSNYCLVGGIIHVALLVLLIIASIMYLCIFKTKDLHIAVTRIPICMMILLIGFFVAHMIYVPIFGVMENLIFAKAETVTYIFFIVCTSILVIEVIFGIVFPFVKKLRVCFLSKFAVILMITFSLFVVFSVVYFFGILLNSWKDKRDISTQQANVFAYNYIHNLCLEETDEEKEGEGEGEGEGEEKIDVVEEIAQLELQLQLLEKSLSPSGLSSQHHTNSHSIPLSFPSSPFSWSTIKEAFAFVYASTIEEYHKAGRFSWSSSSSSSSSSSTSHPHPQSHTPTSLHFHTPRHPTSSTHTSTSSSSPFHPAPSFAATTPHTDCEDTLDWKLQAKLEKRFFSRNVFLGATFFGMYVVFTVLIIAFAAVHFRWYKYVQRRMQRREQKKRDRTMHKRKPPPRDGAAGFVDFLKTGRMNGIDDDDESSSSDGYDDDYFDTQAMVKDEYRKDLSRSSSSLLFSTQRVFPAPSCDPTSAQVPSTPTVELTRSATTLSLARSQGAVPVADEEKEDGDYDYEVVEVDDEAALAAFVCPYSPSSSSSSSSSVLSASSSSVHMPPSYPQTAPSSSTITTSSPSASSRKTLSSSTTKLPPSKSSSSSSYSPPSSPSKLTASSSYVSPPSPPSPSRSITPPSSYSPPSAASSPRPSTPSTPSTPVSTGDDDEDDN